MLGSRPPFSDAPTKESIGTWEAHVQIGESFMNVREATPKANVTGMMHGPERKQMGYLLPFEIVSVHLLVVLIGAAYLARAKRRREAVS